MATRGKRHTEQEKVSFRAMRRDDFRTRTYLDTVDITMMCTVFGVVDTKQVLVLAETRFSDSILKTSDNVGKIKQRRRGKQSRNLQFHFDFHYVSYYSRVCVWVIVARFTFFF